MSALPNAISPNSSTGRPSSCSCRNLAPPDATGRPRAAILALPSPPDASERMPGMLRKISAVERGAEFWIDSMPITLVDTLSCIRVRVPDVPVTTTASRSMAAVDSARSEEHTSELQSLMRISYAVFCVTQKQQSRHSTQVHTEEYT